MSKVALLFPGQGSQSVAMLEALEALPGFSEKYEVLSNYLGPDLAESIKNKDATAINSNLISSGLTVLASVLALEEFQRKYTSKIELVSGYSVGQWTALYAAQMLGYEKLIELVTFRANLMDKCSARRPGGMLAVIGIAPEPIESLCAELSSSEKIIGISNYNWYGEYTLSGDLELIESAQPLIAQLSPKKLARIPVAGAWHSSILNDAACEFEKHLRTCKFDEARAQVLDNVTGDYLDTSPEALTVSLSKHISHPVQWHKGMLQLIADGVTEFTEIGYGNMLTKFGMFINRTVEHRAYFPEPVTI